VTGTPLEVVAVFAAAGLLLAAVIHLLDNLWLARHRPTPPEPPSRLDRLDGHNPPADPSPHTHSPHGQRLSGSAGADLDGWMP
jgi:hypothetical protein